MIKFTLELKKNHSKILQPNQILYHGNYVNDTELPKEYCEIKKNNFIPKVTWGIIRVCPPYYLSKRKYYLCLNEKLEINSYRGKNLDRS